MPLLKWACFLIMLSGCSIKSGDNNYSSESLYRPVIHFTPSVNWTNDPNGLVYYNGKYHLFFQYNPFGRKWGHMSWGHAESENLYDWNHLPVALREMDSTMIFSGSAVIDKNNSGGICPAGTKDCMVAIFTASHKNNLQNQYLAYSPDAGQHWYQYQHNPVIDLGKQDFRDPNLFIYHDSWRLAVSLPLEHKILFYKSGNLVTWQKTGEFGNQGDTSKIWECPDMVRVPVNENDSTTWVLLISSGSPYDSSFTGMQYFVGSFNGKSFVCPETGSQPRWLDYGKDFYAAITYNDLPKGLPIMLGWVNNWAYANDIPTGSWRGMMSVPRNLSLGSIDGNLFLQQKPLNIPDHFIDENAYEINDVELNNTTSDLDEISGDAFILDADMVNHSAVEFGIKIFRSEKFQTEIGVDADKKNFFIDRRTSGMINFNKLFPSRESAPFKKFTDTMNIHMIVDHSVIELFAENGMTVMTEQVFPAGDAKGISLFARGGIAEFKRVRISKINP